MKSRNLYIGIAIIAVFALAAPICYFDMERDNPNDPKAGNYEEWYGIKTVDSTLTSGLYTSIAVDSENVYISYYEASNDDLKFAKSTDGGSTWNIKTVESTGSVGEYTSIAIDGNNVYISYYGVDPDTLKFAKSIDGGSTWPTILTVDGTSGVGKYTSIAVDGNNVYISYYDSSNGNLKFAKSTNGGASWPTVSTVDGDTTIGGKINGNVGEYTSIAVDGSNIYISYYSNTNSDLKFAKSTDYGVTWSDSDVKIVDSGIVGMHTSIAVDGSNVYISYEETSIALKFAKSTDSGATWLAGNIKTVESTGLVIGQYSSIAVNGGNVYISYYDAGSNNDLKFAKSTDSGATWLVANIKIVDSTGVVGQHTSIAVQGSNVYISYRDVTNDNLKFAKSIDGGNTW